MCATSDASLSQMNEWCGVLAGQYGAERTKELPITLSRCVLAGFASVAHNSQCMRARTNAFMENYYILSNAHARNGEIGSLNCGIIVNEVASIASAVSTTCVCVCVENKFAVAAPRNGWAGEPNAEKNAAHRSAKQQK